MLQALDAAEGNIREACRLSGVARSSHYHYYESDATYRADIDAVYDRFGHIGPQIEKNKKALLAALQKYEGHVSRACRQVGVTLQTYTKYKKDDQDFAEKAEQIHDQVNEMLMDDAISQLRKQIREGEFKAIKLVFDKIGPKRGFVEKQQHELSAPSWIQDKELDGI